MRALFSAESFLLCMFPPKLEGFRIYQCVRVSVSKLECALYYNYTLRRLYQKFGMCSCVYVVFFILKLTFFPPSPTDTHTLKVWEKKGCLCAAYCSVKVCIINGHMLCVNIL